MDLLLFSGGLRSAAAARVLSERAPVDCLFVSFGGRALESVVVEVHEKACSGELFVIEAEPSMCTPDTLYAFLSDVGRVFAEENNYGHVFAGKPLPDIPSPLGGLDPVAVAMDAGFFELSSLLDRPYALPSHAEAPDVYALVKSARKAVKKIPHASTFFPPPDRDVVVLDVKEYPVYEFEKGKEYLLVCPRGATSIQLAAELREDGITAYALDTRTAKLFGYVKDAP